YHVPPPSLIYPLSLHDALPIFYHRPSILLPYHGVHHQHPAGSTARHLSLIPVYSVVDKPVGSLVVCDQPGIVTRPDENLIPLDKDRKSTRLNSSHVKISYAVFC